MEFGIRRAELHLNLINGSIDLREGDKLGGELQLNVPKRISTMKKTEDKEPATKISATVSTMNPSIRVVPGVGEHGEGTQYETELQELFI